LQRQPSLLPYRPPSGHDVSSVPLSMYLEPGPEVAQPSLVDVLTDVDPACLPRTAVALVSAPSAVVAHPTRFDVAYARAYGMTSSGIRPTIVSVPCQPGLALPSVTDVVSSRTRVHSDTPIPLRDVGQRDLPMLTYDLSVPTASTLSGNIDAIDIACTPGPSSADVPRPTGVSIHRSVPAVGVRPPKSSVPVDVVKSPSGST